jgi:hypothetical protein
MTIKNIYIFAILMLCLCGCNKQLHLLDPTGSSSMIVTVNGSQDTLSNVTGTDFIGTLEIRGQTKRYKISMDLTSWNLGEHNWLGTDVHLATFYNDTSATGMDHVPIQNIGGYNILSIDNDNRVAEGTFSFVGLNSYTNDTIKVSDGLFKVYYVAEGY